MTSPLNPVYAVNPVYTAHASLDQLVINRAVRAGVDGPCFIDALPDGYSIDNLDLALANAGYTATGPWRTESTVRGMALTVDVERLPRTARES